MNHSGRARLRKPIKKTLINASSSVADSGGQARLPNPELNQIELLILNREAFKVGVTEQCESLSAQEGGLAPPADFDNQPEGLCLITQDACVDQPVPYPTRLGDF